MTWDDPDAKCKHEETVEQLPSIDGEVLIRCKRCGRVMDSYRLGKDGHRHKLGGGT